jgi:predicted KAP-like P-loop ATPase
MVYIYTLSNGEQIIGKYIDNEERGVSTIGDPYYIMESEDQYGNSGMKLINVCTFSKEQCIIVNDTHIVFSIEANEKMTEYYQKLVAAHSNKDTSTMIEDSIKDMEDMENRMREIISKRLVSGSTIN